jgi:hypothetical protein
MPVPYDIDCKIVTVNDATSAKEFPFSGRRERPVSLDVDHSTNDDSRSFASAEQTEAWAALRFAGSANFALARLFSSETLGPSTHRSRT